MVSTIRSQIVVQVMDEEKGKRFGSLSPVTDNPRFIQLAFMATAFFLMSFWLHFPGMSPNNYSDLMDTLWARIQSSGGILPYTDYSLEYPVISGLVLYVSSIWRNMYAFYFSMSLILLGCMLCAIYLVHRILTATGQPLQRISYFIIFTPSFVYFSIYSFDWIGASLMVASIYFAYSRKVRLSGVFMGLSIAARIIPIVCLPVLLYEFKRMKNKAIFAISAVGAWTAVNLYLMVTNFRGFLYPYVFQAGWYAEDSWVVAFGSFAKPLSIILLASLLGVILLWRKRFNIFQKCLLALLAFVMVSYKFPPQYMVLLLPFFALVAVGYGEFMLANMLNVVLILWYFTSVFNLGSPIVASSPVQWVGAARQIALSAVFVKLFLAARKKPLPVDRKVELEPRMLYPDMLRDVPA